MTKLKFSGWHYLVSGWAIALLASCSSGEGYSESVAGRSQAALTVSPQGPRGLLPTLRCVTRDGAGSVAHFGYNYSLPEDDHKPRGEHDSDRHDSDRHDSDRHDSDRHDSEDNDDHEATEAAHGSERSSTSVAVAVGPLNYFSPAPANRGQPTTFASGAHPDAFQVPFGGSISWTLVGTTVTANEKSPACGTAATSNIDLGWSDAPVILRATRSNTAGPSEIGQASLAQPIEFEIPKKLRVQQGNAGDQLAVLSFKDEDNELVQCTYRGGARACRSDDELELAKGRNYVLRSCTKGYRGGQITRSRWFTLGLNGGDDRRGPTAVELHLGVNSCSAPLDPPISAEESVRLRRGFSWQSTAALPETDPDGHPALRYALIYVRDKDEFQALDELFIHSNKKPFFAPELAQYYGRCGSFQYDGDGRGSFVFAILPAATYNLIRQAALNPDPVEGDQTLFESIILRDAPKGMTNADGSLSWRELQHAGYYYRGLRVFPDEPMQQPFWNRLKRRLVKAIAGTVRGVTRAITEGLGAFDRLLFDSTTVAVDMHVLNRDALFGGDVMTRAWGSQAGSELRLGGVRVEVLQNGGLLLPTQFNGILDLDGNVRIRVSSEGSDRGGGLCMDMDNGAATLTTFLLATEVCDFRKFLGPNGFDFTRNLNINIRAQNYEIHTLNEVTDAAHYSMEVAGHTPAHADIAHGWLGNLLSGGKTAYAPCFGFPNISQEVINSGVGAVLSVVGPLGAVLGEVIGAVNQVDIVMPNHAITRDNRAVMVHEYGHFLLCSMLHETNPSAMSAFTAKRVFEGSDVDLGDESAILNEAFADFIAGQVTSSVNYFTPPNSAPSQNMSYCQGTGICLDANGTGVAGDGSQIFGDFPSRYEIAQATTLFHDAFDGSPWRGITRPTNGDAWSLNSTSKLLEFTATEYGDSGDEQITLPGSSIHTWISGWATKTFPTLVKDELFNSLAGVMRGYSWCDKCQMFALHVPNSGSVMRDQMEACTRGPLVNWVGQPPAPLAQLSDSCDVCLPNQILKGGACVACGTGEIANIDASACICADPTHVMVVNSLGQSSCIACGGGRMANATGGCSCANHDEVFNGTSCQACPPGEVPNLTQTACSGCGVDVTVRLEQNGCIFSGETTIQGAQSSLCDGVQIVEFTGVNGVFASGCNITTLPFSVISSTSDQTVCQAVHADVAVKLVNGVGLATPYLQEQRVGQFSDGVFACTGSGTCLNLTGPACGVEQFEVPVSLASGVDTVRVIAKTSATLTYSSLVGYTVIR